LELLRKYGQETHQIISEAALQTISAETDWSVAKVESLAEVCYDPRQIGAHIASGSFVTEGMLVAP
jgi:4-hydroxy-3-polyprenylbenzoate decarboxylase